MKRRRPIYTRLMSGAVVAAALFAGATAGLAQSTGVAGKLEIVDSAGTSVISNVLQQIAVHAALSVSANSHGRGIADIGTNRGLTGANYVASIHRAHDSTSRETPVGLPSDRSTRRGKPGKNLILAQYN